MDDMKTPEGIDFFDFLYEIWQAKWLFALIIAICAGLAIVPSLFRNGVPYVESVEDTTAQFGFALRIYNDPLQRNGGQLLTDIVGLTDADGRLDLQYAGLINQNVAGYFGLISKFDRLYGFHFIAENNGLIVLNLKGGDEALYRAVHEEFLRAAEQQFAQAKAFAEGVVASYTEWEKDRTSLTYLSMPGQIMLALQFLETPSVQDGTFRFFEFRPLEIRATQTSIVTKATLSSIKMVFLGGIVGFILACVMVMFRIAIKRKKLGAAEA